MDPSYRHSRLSDLASVDDLAGIAYDAGVQFGAAGYQGRTMPQGDSERKRIFAAGGPARETVSPGSVETDTFYRSFFQSKNTPARLTRKRIIFLTLFYIVWIPGSLLHWFFFWLDDILFPAHKTQPLNKPLFILGNLRSGSTFLHRLLSRDSGTFTSLTTWDIYLTPSVTQKKITQFVARLDKKYFSNTLHRLLYAFDRATLGKFRIHPISFFQPEEDENIHLHIWDGFFVTFLFPFMDEFPDYRHFDEALSQNP